MEVSRRAGFLPALAICLFALTLGACGVKGALESPPGAKTAASDVAAEGEVGLHEKVFVERSQVKSVGTPPIIPQLPPKEWEKDRNAKTDDSRASGGALRRSTPDKPFILDWLL